jgi:hypothetical protein
MWGRGAAAVRGAALSSRVLQLRLVCPPAEDAGAWGAVVAPWAAALLQVADKLGEGVRLSKAAEAAARAPRESIVRERLKKAVEEQRAKEKMEREKREEEEEKRMLEGMTKGAAMALCSRPTSPRPTFSLALLLTRQPRPPFPAPPPPPSEKRLAYISMRRQQREIEEIQRLHKAGVKIPGMPDLRPGEKLNLPKPKMK